MPDDFPRIDISEREDADHVFEMIRKHAFLLAKKELAKVGEGQDAKAVKSCEKAIDKWIASARSKLEPNLSVNGMSFSEGGAKSELRKRGKHGEAKQKGLTGFSNITAEAFDQALSQKVQQLTEQADNLTAEVIEARKSLPARRAAALQARYKLMDQVQSNVEAKRRVAEEKFEMQGVQGINSGRVTFKRSEEVKQTLESAVSDIEKLAVALLEQASAANEQAKFVKRLRTMSASYS